MKVYVLVREYGDEGEDIQGIYKNHKTATEAARKMVEEQSAYYYFEEQKSNDASMVFYSISCNVSVKVYAIEVDES